MAAGVFKVRKRSSLTVLVIAGMGAALVGALPASAAVADIPAVHGMGLSRSVAATVAPSEGLRALATLAGPISVLPASVNLSRYAEKVGDQGQVNSCVAWAVGYGMMGWFARSQGHAGAPYAPMYTYSQVNGGRDQGSSPIDVLEVLRTQGDATAAQYALGHPFSTLDWNHQPSVASHTAAAANKITGWISLYNTNGAPGAQAVTALKRTLASGRPVALGFAVYQRFENAHGPGAGSVVTGSGDPGRLLGYHEVLALGYDARGVLIQNSWGTGWGDRGYAILDWTYVAKYTDEAETMAGLATTTGANRPVITTVTTAANSAGQAVTLTGSKLASAIVTLGTRTFAPTSSTSDGRKLTFQVPEGTADVVALSVSTPGGVSLIRSYNMRRR